MDDNKHLQLVKEGESHFAHSEKKIHDEEVVLVLSDRIKITILFFIMGVLPLSAYQLGSDSWGTEIGTHFAVGVGAICTLIASLLIYILGWMDDPKET